MKGSPTVKSNSNCSGTAWRRGWCANGGPFTCRLRWPSLCLPPPTSFRPSSSGGGNETLPLDRNLADTGGDHLPELPSPEIGRAPVCTPVTNAHLVCRLL